jgi:hypothetical protein
MRAASAVRFRLLLLVLPEEIDKAAPPLPLHFPSSIASSANAFSQIAMTARRSKDVDIFISHFLSNEMPI